MRNYLISAVQIAGVVVAGLLVAWAVVALATGAGESMRDPIPVPTGSPNGQVVPVTLCTEDMACWDCTTMGNLVCGPDSKP